MPQTSAHSSARTFRRLGLLGTLGAQRIDYDSERCSNVRPSRQRRLCDLLGSAAPRFSPTPAFLALSGLLGADDAARGSDDPDPRFACSSCACRVAKDRTVCLVCIDIAYSTKGGVWGGARDGSQENARPL